MTTKVEEIATTAQEVDALRAVAEAAMLEARKRGFPAVALAVVMGDGGIACALADDAAHPRGAEGYATLVLHASDAMKIHADLHVRGALVKARRERGEAVVAATVGNGQVGHA